jgi:hypothetical protein
MITNATNDFKAIPQTSFQQCFQKWKGQMEGCSDVQGDYFEGDTIQ